MLEPEQRVVITGIGLTSPNGDSLEDFRQALVEGRSGVQPYEIRYVGATLAGICHFDETRYQKLRALRTGTRAGSVSIYCSQEAVKRSGLDFDAIDRARVGVFIGITEHGNVETENEVYDLSQYDYDIKYWSHHHNPRTVANNPAGEVTVNMGITGPHYTLGAACAAGNAGLIQGAQMLRLGESPRRSTPSGSSRASRRRARSPPTMTPPRPHGRSTRPATGSWSPRAARST